MGAAQEVFFLITLCYRMMTCFSNGMVTQQLIEGGCGFDVSLD